MTTPLAGRGYREFDAYIKSYGERVVKENPAAITKDLVDHVKDIMIENMDKVGPTSSQNAFSNCELQALNRHTKIEVILKDAESLKQVVSAPCGLACITRLIDAVLVEYEVSQRGERGKTSHVLEEL